MGGCDWPMRIRVAPMSETQVFYRRRSCSVACYMLPSRSRSESRENCQGLDRSLYLLDSSSQGSSSGRWRLAHELRDGSSDPIGKLPRFNFSIALLSDNFHGFIPVPSPRYRRPVVYNFYYLRYRDGERARLRRENCTLLPEGTFQMSCLRRG